MEIYLMSRSVDVYLDDKRNKDGNDFQDNYILALINSKG